MRRAVPLSPRFHSQVFSTSQWFPGKPSFRGFISRRNRSWDLPSERSPRKNCAPLSGPPCSLAVIHPPAVANHLCLIATGLADVHAFTQLPDFLPATMDFFSTNPKACFPVALDADDGAAAFSELHLFRSFVPLANPFAIDASCPSPTADALLGFSSLECSPTTP